MDSNFILINEQKLKSYFEKNADNKILSAIEKREWHEVIYFENALAYNQKIEGFINVHPTAYNRIQSLTFSILISENQFEFGFKKYEAGYYLEKPFCAVWLDFMLTLCKRFNEHEYDETDWDLFDLTIPEAHQKMVEQYFEWQLNNSFNSNSKITENYTEIASRIIDFKFIKKELNKNNFDFLLFYFSY